MNLKNILGATFLAVIMAFAISQQACSHHMSHHAKGGDKVACESYKGKGCCKSKESCPVKEGEKKKDCSRNKCPMTGKSEAK